MWILLLIPRIEDGNNFGVSIQEDTLTEVRTVETEAATYFDQVSRYYISRGKIVAKIAKYPHVVSPACLLRLARSPGNAVQLDRCCASANLCHWTIDRRSDYCFPQQSHRCLHPHTRFLYYTVTLSCRVCLD